MTSSVSASNNDTADEPEFLLGTTGGHLAISTGFILTAGIVLAVFGGLWLLLISAAALSALWLLSYGVVHLFRHRPRISLPSAAPIHTHLPYAA